MIHLNTYIKLIYVLPGIYELTYRESEKRLIILGSIIAVCLLLVSTAFVLIVVRLYGKYKTPKLYQPEQGNIEFQINGLV